MQGEYISFGYAKKVSFVQEKMKRTKQLQAESFATRSDQLEQTFKAYQIMFCEVIERLPSSKKVLAAIKREYESVIATIQHKNKESTAQWQKELVKVYNIGTISNYRKRIKELDLKMAKLKHDNGRIKNEVEQMRSEIDSMLQEIDYQHQLLKAQTLCLNGKKRRNLGLPLDRVTSIGHLQEELQCVRKELVDARIIAEKEYVPSERKAHLNQVLKDKEDKKAKLDNVNTTLAKQLRRLKFSTQAIDSYRLYLQENCLDSSSLPLIHYINAALENSFEDVSEEESDDPAQEIEVEMISDCFKKFNELFKGERYDEAALQAASSPKGVLRTMDTLNKFKQFAKHIPGKKLPLLCYCEYLMQCAPAYRPISQEESIECIKCALDTNRISLITNWIAQGALYPSPQVGKLLTSLCQCLSRCTCGCNGTAFYILDKCGEHKLAALCLVHQEKFMAFLSFSKRIGLTKDEFVRLLYSNPSMKFAEILVHPPTPYAPIVTIFEAANILLQRGQIKEVASFLTKVKENDYMQALPEDEKWVCNNSVDVWQNLIDNLQNAGLTEWAVEICSVLTVKRVLQIVTNSLTEEASGNSVMGNIDSSYQPFSAYSPGTKEQLSLSDMSSESTSAMTESDSGSGYSSEIDSVSSL